MNQEDLQNRIIELQKQKEILLRNLDALDGAIQDCEYWIRKINEQGENHAT